MPDTQSMRDHWWWRPGWAVGRKMYTWHITFAGQEPFFELANAYQAALKPLPGLDLIPLRWLHLTMQGVGFTHEVSEDDACRIADAARTRLASTPRFSLTFRKPRVDPEAIMFDPEPTEPARAVRDEIRAAIAQVWGPDRVPESDQWSPHVSIAYSNATGPATPYEKALAEVDAEAATITVTNVELIVLNRDNKMYEWDTYAAIPLAAG